MPEPGYRNLYHSGELEKRAEKAYEILKDCVLCPHHCHVDRTKDELGYCRTGNDIKVASYGPHFGEETPLVGLRGSGTIFFSQCNLRCVFCQNYDISHLGEGEEVTVKELAEIMLFLQKRGCHNINFVTPSHMIHALLAATLEACETGLKVPLVYNSGGYDDVNALKLLDGVIDIYMPDIKYADEKVALNYSRIPKYFTIVKKAIKEMHRQVGDLKIENKIAVKGLIIRHLILPEDLAGTREIMEFISKEISPDSYINIMEQYYPAYKASEYEPLNRRITGDEYDKALEIAREAGLRRFEL
ncbi:MAG: putative pyruvate formate lyase activating enzyme [Halanaerobiales bacterium]|nr:putative pyruvate formate lyase activating enzyme [Halanaerobiales bacterium]